LEFAEQEGSAAVAEVLVNVAVFVRGILVLGKKRRQLVNQQKKIQKGKEVESEERAEKAERTDRIAFKPEGGLG
jgi:hypothetical protein